MADRVPSDHPSVETVRATLVRRGSTNRPAVELPDDARETFPAGEVVRVVLDGDERHARVEDRLGDRILPGVYDSPSFARRPGDARNRLVEWYERSDLSIGRSVAVDVIEEGFKYGLRKPGERVVYDATESPDESLTSIAERLDRDG